MCFSKVRMVGFEPTISCSRSTRHEKATPCQAFPHPDNEERPARIELAIPPWQGDGLPLHHGRLLLAQPNCQRSRAPSEDRTHAAALRKRCHSTRPSVLIHSVGSVGIEPTSTGLRVRCITLSATIPFVFVFQVGVEGIEPSTFVL
jgi:hypothetical protein